jgi:hypothetical protein
MTMQPDVRVHVEHLVLEGIDPSDRYAVAQALQAELGRALGERGVAGWLSADGGAAQVYGGELVLPRHASASAVGSGAGAHIARALSGKGEP